MAFNSFGGGEEKTDSLPFRNQNFPSQDGVRQGRFNMDMTEEERLEMLASRFGISIEELKEELNSGKSIEQVAEELGVEMGGRFGNRTSSGSMPSIRTASGENIPNNSPEINENN